MNANDLIRRYWAGDYHFGKDNQFEKFIHNENWKIGWSNEDKDSKPFYQRINEIKIGDFFALKSFGENYDLTVSALGIVIDTTEKSLGELKVKWLKLNQLYKGKAPRGSGIDNWFGALLEVKRVEDIAEIFDPLFQPQEEEIRVFVANSDAFEFWGSEGEDIYQDYLKKAN